MPPISASNQPPSHPSNDRLDLISKLTKDALFEWNLSTNEIWWSESHFTFFGFDPAKPIPSQAEWLERIHPADHRSLNESLTQITTDPQTTELQKEIRYKQSDGNYGTALMRCYLFHQADGKPNWVIGSFLDITPIKKLEQELRLKETAIATAISGLGFADLNGNITYANEALIAMWGCQNQNELIGKNLAEVFEGPRVQQTIANLRTRGYDHGEDIGKKMDGTLFDVAFSANVVMDQEGKPQCLFGSFMDISAGKKASKVIAVILEELAQTIKNANAIIIAIDQSGNITEWNKLAEQSMGFSREEVLGTNLINRFIPAQNRTSTEQKITEILAGSIKTGEEVTMLSRNDHQIIVLLSATPQVNSKKQITGVVLIGQDITELTFYRRSLEQQVALRTAELQEALQAEKRLVDLKSKFVSVASHEFRTPLSTITLSAAFVRRYKKKLSEAEIDAKLEAIEKNVQHMSLLLNDVLMIGQMDSGNLEVHRSVVNCEMFEMMVQEIMQGQHTAHRLELSIVRKHNFIYSDEKLLRSILTNLLSNAVKFSPAAEVVKLDLRCDDRLEIAVTDYGIGIPTEEAGNLFTSFYRASNALTIEGTGLGLAIVKKSVDLLGGTIHVHSVQNAGTTIAVQLPLVNP